jgi:hypothetical protein
MRRSHIARALVVLGAGAAALAAVTPAGAAAGGGVVTGNVTIVTPATGIPLTGPCTPTTYTFSSVVLDGVINHAGKTYAGPIKTSNVKGGSSCDVGTGPTTGTVNTAANPATFSGAVGAMTISGKFYGTFTRVATHVIVSLNVIQAKICNASGCGAPFSTRVRLDVSEFIPTQVSGGIKRATFAGEFHIGSV